MKRTVEELVACIPALTLVTGSGQGRAASVVVTGIGEQFAPPPGAIVLAIGSGWEESVIRTAAAAGAAAVVLRAPVNAELSHEAAGLAVLALDVSVPWDDLRVQLAAMLSFEPDPGSDLFSLCDQLAMTVGGAVCVEDVDHRLLAYSSVGQPVDDSRLNALLRRGLPPGQEIFEEMYAAVRRATGPVWGEFGEPATRPRTACPIRAGDRLLGSLWVISPERPSDEAERAISVAANVAAFQLLQQGDDPIRRQQERRVLNLLYGNEPTAAHALGLPLRGDYAVVVFSALHNGATDGDCVAERVAELARAFAAAHRSRICVARDGCVVLAIVPLETQASAARFAHEIVTRTHAALCLRIRAGIGAVAVGVAGLVPSCEAAMQALYALAPDDQRSVVEIDEVRASILLGDIAALGAADRSRLLPVLVAMLDSDERRGSPFYVPSLKAYLDAREDMAVAAEVIGISSNTLRYRLRRLQEEFSLDLDDPESRLVLWLQLRLSAS